MTSARAGAFGLSAVDSARGAGEPSPCGQGRLVSASVAPATRRTYASALKRFDASASGREVTDAFVADYLSSRFEAGQAPSTCGQLVAALRFRARQQGRSSPIGPATERLLSGLRRRGRARGRGQVAGVGFADAARASALASADGDLAGLRDAALIDTMSDGLLRVSELAALEVSDVTFPPSHGSGRVRIGLSKTDPHGAGAVVYLGAPTVARLRAWLDASGIRDGPLFRRFYRGGKVGSTSLSTVTVRNIIKRRCAAAGLTGRISGHSLAAGGASITDMQHAGRWNSPQMPAHYARGQLAGRGAVARFKYGWPEPDSRKTKRMNP